MMALAEFRAGMSRLTGWPETYAYYIARKVTDTLGIFVLFATLLHVPALWAAWSAWTLYVGWGLWSWYHGRRPITFSVAPGKFLGDALYHGWISAIVLLCLYAYALAWWWRLSLTVLWLCVWTLLYLKGYGLMRNPDSVET